MKHAQLAIFTAIAFLAFAITTLTVRPTPEPEPRCVLVGLERVPGAPQLNLPGHPILGGGVYEVWTCDGHEIRTWVEP